MPEGVVDWGDLFARYEVMATAFARGLVQDGDLARDLFQEAARAVYERATTGGVAFESAAHARNYLFQTLRNLAADARSGRRKAPAELGDDPADPRDGPAADLLARERTERRSEQLRAAFAKLPAREQQALTLRYVEGQPYKAIAKAVGKSISTVQARVEKGLERLRNGIGKPENEE